MIPDAKTDREYEAYAKTTRNWDSVARRYVEHDTTAQETFGAISYNDSGLLPPHSADWVRQNVANDNDRGPYVQAYTGRFYPFDPSPAETRIEDIAHGLAHSARYNGAGKRYYSTAEHSVLIANWIWWHSTAQDALCGLLHDAPEPLSGFGDVLRPVKDRAPIIKETETNIWRKAIAPAFGLPLDLPAIVHEADSRIIADEMAANMSDVDPGYRDPLGVELQFWTPDEAEAAFLRTLLRLQNMRAAA
ncbi:hypothetical protein [Mesorhizobium sp.]|uniref:hypothetical protein n=1 Tax=Mesorhizobium sp. TaxID=1871066 RepID=UPI001206D7B3|nr:hypothetical protein [Mesorhizobium sp.]TIL38504.1 MAG: hypothetical protein E5Y82_13450 [Mesorhizobium sp.]